MEKNIWSISRLLREHPHLELRNEPSLDSLECPSQTPFWPASRSVVEQAGHKRVWGWRPQTIKEAHFEAQYQDVLAAALNSTGYFFPTSIFPEVQCFGKVYLGFLRNV